MEQNLSFSRKWAKRLRMRARHKRNFPFYSDIQEELSEKECSARSTEIICRKNRISLVYKDEFFSQCRISRGGLVAEDNFVLVLFKARYFFILRIKF